MILDNRSPHPHSIPRPALEQGGWKRRELVPWCGSERAVRQMRELEVLPWAISHTLKGRPWNVFHCWLQWREVKTKRLTDAILKESIETSKNYSSTQDTV
jgi:hypothetical protein